MIGADISIGQAKANIQGAYGRIIYDYWENLSRG